LSEPPSGPGDLNNRAPPYGGRNHSNLDEKLDKLSKPGTRQDLEGMKKGMTKFYLTPEEEKQYLEYTPINPEIL
jgi:hypothetical protein